MKCFTVIAFSGLISIFTSQSMAMGVLKLSRTELRFAPDERRSELYAQNTGDTPLYLDVEQKLLLNPGQYPEQLMSIYEVRRPSLLVTPSRLILAPGQKYKMTFKELAIPVYNQVWRITFRPRERLIAQANLPGGQFAPLAVSVGYGVVIYQQGLKPDNHSMPE